MELLGTWFMLAAQKLLINLFGSLLGVFFPLFFSTGIDGGGGKIALELLLSCL